MSAPWNQLLEIAQSVVSETCAELPPDLQKHVANVAIVYQTTPDAALLEEGWEPDILGLYTGDPIHVGHGEANPVPREIRLFLTNLWNYVDGDAEEYREEIRVTFLHEFGHYLGLDEEDLEERDLT